jgi:hypothetical protein
MQRPFAVSSLIHLQLMRRNCVLILADPLSNLRQGVCLTSGKDRRILGPYRRRICCRARKTRRRSSRGGSPSPRGTASILPRNTLRRGLMIQVLKHLGIEPGDDAVVAMEPEDGHRNRGLGSRLRGMLATEIRVNEPGAPDRRPLVSPASLRGGGDGSIPGALPPTGYHQTITLAWLAVIAWFLGEHDDGQHFPLLVGASNIRFARAGSWARYWRPSAWTR